MRDRLLLYYNDLVFSPSETFLQKDFGQVPYVLADLHGLDLEYWIAARNPNPHFHQFRNRPVRQFAKRPKGLPARLDVMANSPVRRALSRTGKVAYLLLFPFTPRSDLAVVRAAARAHPGLKVLLKLDANKELLLRIAADWERRGKVVGNLRESAHYRELLRLADVVLCETDECCSILRGEFLGLRIKDKLVQTYSALSEGWLAEMGIEPPREVARENVIVVSGRISAEQKATQMIFAAGPPPASWRIEFVGEVEPNLAAEIERARAADPSFDDHYRFHGAVRDKVSYFRILSRARALLMNSIGGEGFPNVFAEAHFCRLLIVASATSGTSEATAGGRFGIIYEPGDVDGLRNALQTIPDRVARFDEQPVPAYFRHQFLWEHSLTQPAIARVFSERPASGRG